MGTWHGRLWRPRDHTQPRGTETCSRGSRKRSTGAQTTAGLGERRLSPPQPPRHTVALCFQRVLTAARPPREPPTRGEVPGSRAGAGKPLGRRFERRLRHPAATSWRRREQTQEESLVPARRSRRLDSRFAPALRAPGTQILRQGVSAPSSEQPLPPPGARGAPRAARPRHHPRQQPGQGDWGRSQLAGG